MHSYVTINKILKECVTNLNSNLIIEEVVLETGATLTRCGEYRILHLLNASSTEKGITFLPIQDAPQKSIGAAAVVKGSATNNLYITVDYNGYVKLFNNGKIQAATNAITGCISWFVH